jgi:hypothetical protein
MDSETIDKLIIAGKNSGEKDKIIDLFIEGQNVLLGEIEILVIKLKRIDKDFCIELLASQLEYLNDMLALSTRRLTKEPIESMTPEQALLIASFNKIIDDFEKQDEIKISS